MPESLLTLFERIRRNAESGKVGAEISKHGVRFFAIDLCDVCGCECEGPEGTAWLRVEGWTYQDYIETVGPYLVQLPELGACDALAGIAVCPDCWRSE